MSNRSLNDEMTIKSTANTQTFLETCVLDADLKALKVHLVSNPVQQSDLDRCLLRGLQSVQWEEGELSQAAQALTILLKTGAKWNSDVLLDDQKTPYHIICESPGDHHELLELMIKSSQPSIIDAQDIDKHTALIDAVQNANINCLKSLITNGADINIENDRYCRGRILQPCTAIMVAIENIIENKSAINVDIFDLLLESGADVNKATFKFNNYFMSPLIYAAVFRNMYMYCIQQDAREAMRVVFSVLTKRICMHKTNFLRTYSNIVLKVILNCMNMQIATQLIMMYNL